MLSNMDITNKHKPLSILVLMLLAYSLLNLPVINTLWRHSFDDGTYSHAYLIPLISLYLLYLVGNHQLIAFRDRPSLLAIGATLSIALAYYVSVNAQMSLGYWLCFLFLGISLVFNIFKFNKYLLFPLLYFVFLIPLWGSLTTPLQSLSVVAVSFMMSFTGIPVYVHAPYVEIPAGTFEIAHGCSGLRYVLTSLAISSLYVFLFIRDRKKAFIFFTLALLGGLITNWIRITLLILIGHWTDMTHSLMNDHNHFGWYIFMPFMLLLFWFGNKIADFDFTRKFNKEASKLRLAASCGVVVAVFAVLTSTTLATLNSANGKHIVSLSAEKSEPFIKFYQDRVISTTEDSTNIVYSFSASDLDNKPSYFENDIAPTGWRKVKELNAGTYLFRKNRKLATVQVQYQLEEQYFNSKRDFKLARIKQGLTNNQNIKLHWKMNRCSSTNCINELASIQD